MASLFAAVCLFGSSADAQRPTSVADAGPRPMRVAEGNNVQCAGYVTSSSIDTSSRIIGGYNEQDGWFYTEGQTVYLSLSGARVGDVYSVVRPRGQVKTEWSKKELGMYVQEVGSVEVIRMKGDHAVAKVKRSCDNFLLGDLVRPMENREVPAYVDRPMLDRFADPSGKAMGRLFMARDNQEVLSTENIVYVDLGVEDNVKIGDFMTVFRPLGTGNPLKNNQRESMEARNRNYGSWEYKGGEFSNQTARKSGENARGRVVTTPKGKEGRPEIRKVVGELIVLNVKERVATAMIVRNAQEIHTGDWVEVQ